MNEPAPSPDPAALWALVERWEAEARDSDRQAALATAAGFTALARSREADARANRRCAAALRALLPPEGT